MMDLPFADLAEKLLISFKFVKSLYDMDEITIEEVVYEMEKYQQDPIAFMKENEVIKSDAKDYVVVFSRIIENNAEAVLDYLYEKYNDEILELAYLSFISAI